MVFRALVTDKAATGEVTSSVQSVDESALPPGNVLVAVDWAGFNYKDGLALAGRGNIIRSFPHVAGIDFAGRVIESRNYRYHPGQSVILTGWRVGETRWGGFAERARVDAEWLVPMPKRLSARTSMMLGTAGLTAMLAINRLKGDGLVPAKGDILVTGASGGVGSIAVMLLARLGYRVVAATGRMSEADHLTRLGAAEVLDRKELLESSGKGLDAERWAAAIDPVGGEVLTQILKKIRYGGAVASIGLAGGANFDGSVLPFILRNVTLFGIDSVMQPYEARIAAWERLASLFVPGAYEPMVSERYLEDLPREAQIILRGGVAGRVIVNPKAAPGEVVRLPTHSGA